MPKRRSRLLLIFAIILLAVAVIFAKDIAHSVRIYHNNRLADQLLREAESGHNDPALKTKMSNLLEGDDLSRAKGDLLLRALVSQRALVRDSYCIWYPPVVKLAIDPTPDFDSLILRASAKAMAGSHCLGEVADFAPDQASIPNYEFYEALTTNGVIVPTQTRGNYDAALLLQYKLYPKDSPSRNSSSSPLNVEKVRSASAQFVASTPKFACEISLPVHLHVTNKIELGLVYSAELETKVRDCFTVFPGGDTNSPPPLAASAAIPAFKRTDAANSPAKTPASPLQIKSDFLLKISNAPTNLALGIKYRDDGAKEHVSTNFSLVVRAGQSAQVSLKDITDVFGLTATNHYFGDLFFFADARAAYTDPELKEIWQGSLGFQVDFDVVRKSTNSAPHAN